MKSNHNNEDALDFLPKAVINMSKIQNEIKSQLDRLDELKDSAVINMSKIQNEIKSQQGFGNISLDNGCYQYVKDTK